MKNVVTELCLLNSVLEKIILFIINSVERKSSLFLIDIYSKIMNNLLRKILRFFFEVYMIAIKPVSDLRNYNEVLQDVADESPVFLTKNGRGCYAVISIKDYEKLTATRTLFSELKKGEDSAKEKGWLSTKNVREMVGL